MMVSRIAAAAAVDELAALDRREAVLKGVKKPPAKVGRCRLTV
jgi:hypothetical protein